MYIVFDTQTSTGFSRRLSVFETKFLPRIFGPICEGELWRKMYNRESKELYNEPNIPPPPAVAEV